MNKTSWTISSHSITAHIVAQRCIMGSDAQYAIKVAENMVKMPIDNYSDEKLKAVANTLAAEINQLKKRVEMLESSIGNEGLYKCISCGVSGTKKNNMNVGI